MTATVVSRGKPAAAAAPRPVTVLDDILLELIDIGDNVRVDVGELEELAASIAELGVLDPVKVTRQDDGRYRLVWGQRRVLASLQAGKLRIPAIIEPASDIDDKSARRSIEQLSENLQRKDLNPIEEAVALREVLDGDPKLTQADLARRLGVSAPWVSNTLGLLEAAEPVQELVRDGKLTASHVKAMLGLAKTTQVQFAKQAVERGSSAHRLEDDIQSYKRSEEWQKKRELEEREANKAREGAWAAAIDKKLAKVPKDTAIIVSRYYGNDGKVGHVADMLRKAGFTQVSTGNVSSRASAADCNCGVWKVEPQYERLSIVPGCTNNKHLQAKTAADDAKRRAKYDLEGRVQAKLKDTATDHVGHTDKSVVLDPLLARMALWHALGYRSADWAEARGGKRGNPWASIVELDNETLSNALARAVAESFRDNYGYHVPWDEIAALVDVDVEPPPAVKAAKRKKAPTGPGFTPEQARQAAAELERDLDG